MRNYLLLILSILFVGYLPVLGQSDSVVFSSKNFFMEEDSVKPDFLLLLYPHQAVEDTAYCNLSVYLPKTLEERYVRIYLGCYGHPIMFPRYWWWTDGDEMHQ